MEERRNTFEQPVSWITIGEIEMPVRMGRALHVAASQVSVALLSANDRPSSASLIDFVGAGGG
jgi:hypothetical protein